MAMPKIKLARMSILGSRPCRDGMIGATRQSLRHFIERLSPYQALTLLAVPVCLVEPLKLAAVAVVGEGHWITGAAMIAAAYAGSLLLVERLFLLVKPKLLRLRWFARLLAWVIVRRYLLIKVLRSA